MMIPAERRGSSRYCSGGLSSGMPNGSVLNNVLVVAEQASLGDEDLVRRPAVLQVV